MSSSRKLPRDHSPCSPRVSRGQRQSGSSARQLPSKRAMERAMQSLLVHDLRLSALAGSGPGARAGAAAKAFYAAAMAGRHPALSPDTGGGGGGGGGGGTGAGGAGGAKRKCEVRSPRARRGAKHTPRDTLLSPKAVPCEKKGSSSQLRPARSQGGIMPSVSLTSTSSARTSKTRKKHKRKRAASLSPRRSVVWGAQSRASVRRVRSSERCAGGRARERAGRTPSPSQTASPRWAAAGPAGRAPARAKPGRGPKWSPRRALLKGRATIVVPITKAPAPPPAPAALKLPTDSAHARARAWDLRAQQLRLQGLVSRLAHRNVDSATECPLGTALPAQTLHIPEERLLWHCGRRRRGGGPGRGRGGGGGGGRRGGGGAKGQTRRRASPSSSSEDSAGSDDPLFSSSDARSLPRADRRRSPGSPGRKTGSPKSKQPVAQRADPTGAAPLAQPVASGCAAAAVSQDSLATASTEDAAAHAPVAARPHAPAALPKAARHLALITTARRATPGRIHPAALRLVPPPRAFSPPAPAGAPAQLHGLVPGRGVAVSKRAQLPPSAEPGPPPASGRVRGSPKGRRASRLAPRVGPAVAAAAGRRALSARRSAGRRLVRSGSDARKKASLARRKEGRDANLNPGSESSSATSDSRRTTLSLPAKISPKQSQRFNTTIPSINVLQLPTKKATCLDRRNSSSSHPSTPSSKTRGVPSSLQTHSATKRNVWILNSSIKAYKDTLSALLPNTAELLADPKPPLRSNPPKPGKHLGPSPAFHKSLLHRGARCTLNATSRPGVFVAMEKAHRVIQSLLAPARRDGPYRPGPSQAPAATAPPANAPAPASNPPAPPDALAAEGAALAPPIPATPALPNAPPCTPAQPSAVSVISTKVTPKRRHNQPIVASTWVDMCSSPSSSCSSSSEILKRPLSLKTVPSSHKTKTSRASPSTSAKRRRRQLRSSGKSTRIPPLKSYPPPSTDAAFVGRGSESPASSVRSWLDSTVSGSPPSTPAPASSRPGYKTVAARSAKSSAGASPPARRTVAGEPLASSERDRFVAIPSLVPPQGEPVMPSEAAITGAPAPPPPTASSSYHRLREKGPRPRSDEERAKHSPPPPAERRKSPQTAADEPVYGVSGVTLRSAPERCPLRQVVWGHAVRLPFFHVDAPEAPRAAEPKGAAAHRKISLDT